MFLNLPNFLNNALGIGEGETLVRLTGLEPNQQYKISLIFRTSAGTFRSNFLTTSTCGLDDFSGLYLAIKRGIPETEEVEQLAKEMGVKLELFDADFDKDTITHIICNEASSLSEVVALKASEANIPVVTTSWLKNCKEAGRLQTDNQFSLA